MACIESGNSSKERPLHVNLDQPHLLQMDKLRRRERKGFAENRQDVSGCAEA